MKKKYPGILTALMFVAMVAFHCVTVSAALGDVIIDNGDPQTSYTGYWGVSGATGFYGKTSLWSRDGSTYTYTFTAPSTGTYEISLWWTSWPSRSSSVPVNIEFSGGTDTWTINQQKNGGKWNAVVSRPFIGGQRYDITVISQPGPASTCVDAIRFVPLQSAGSGIVIDNGDPGTSSTGVWGVSGGYNPYGTTSIWNRDGATYTWSFVPPVSGNYALSMWWTQYSSRSDKVPVRIESSNGTKIYYVNQQTNGGQWNLIDPFPFESGNTYTVTITAQPAPSSTCADAVMFKLLDSVPFVSIASPPSYHLQRSRDLAVSASAANLNSAWAVKFIRDAGTASEVSIVDNSSPYSALFPATPVGEHTVNAVVVDAAGNPVPNVISADIVQIGVGGRLIISVGDSNTTGYGDDDLSDDISQDGRVTGGGYPPILNDLLTAEHAAVGTPFMIANEAVAGSTSADGAASIKAILGKYPEAELCIVQYGVNEAARGMPSGRGLKPGDPGYAKSYKDYMQQIITACRNAGVEVAIAKAPIARGLFRKPPYTNPDQEGVNILIKQYNEVISELRSISANQIRRPMPDFYHYFNSINPSTQLHRYDELYYDNIHPDGQGTKEMARMWFEAIERFGAYIDQVSPNPAAVGTAVQFKGYGSDPDPGGSIIAYEWQSDIDGVLGTSANFATSLSVGNHIISFFAQNSDYKWSAPAEIAVAVGQAPREIIIDNRDSRTSRTGNWPVSGGPKPYGADSFWSEDGSTFSWLFTPPQSGAYQVSMWWTQYASRSDSIPVTIAHNGGQNRKFIDQQKNGGKWNALGTYTFTAGNVYRITIISQPDPSSTCADAVRFVLAP